MAEDLPHERRRKKRFQVKDGCLVTLGNDPIKPWQILDISEEGLAFRYIGGAEQPEGMTAVDILTCDTTLCIEKVPCRFVSDFKMPGQIPKRYPLNRCSVEFRSLTQHQMGQLESLIRSYTVG